MSYEMMEALVVSKIAGLRDSEAMFARSLQAARNGADLDLKAAQQRLDAQLQDLEQLLERMDSDSAFDTTAIPALVAVEAAQQLPSSVWM
ncbi:MAG TPA: hypothetical protein VER03_23545 [Bryobacteraceae bacterium]|nr:hypothetical protein [Bryobacteraceae bacterium]